jgi:hypothetical protein
MEIYLILLKNAPVCGYFSLSGACKHIGTTPPTARKRMREGARMIQGDFEIIIFEVHKRKPRGKRK